MHKTTKNKVIGLISTAGTINSRYMQKQILQYSLNNIIQVISTNTLAEITEKKLEDY